MPDLQVRLGNREQRSITAKTPASLGLLSQTETSPIKGIRIPTIMKNPAKARLRSSGIRVSTPSGLSRIPKMKPTPNKIANIRSGLVRGFFVEISFIKSDPFIHIIWTWRIINLAIRDFLENKIQIKEIHALKF